MACIGNGANKLSTGYCSGTLLSPLKDHVLDSEGYDKKIKEICEEISKNSRL